MSATTTCSRDGPTTRCWTAARTSCELARRDAPRHPGAAGDLRRRVGRPRRRRLAHLGPRDAPGGRPGRRGDRRPGGHDGAAAERRRPARLVASASTSGRSATGSSTARGSGPAPHYLWSEHRRYGVEPVVVPLDDDGVHLDVQRLADAVDERTAVVHCSLVLFRTSTLLDLRRSSSARTRWARSWWSTPTRRSARCPSRSSTSASTSASAARSSTCPVVPATAGCTSRPRSPSAAAGRLGWFSHTAPFDFDFADIRLRRRGRPLQSGTPNVPAAYAAAPAVPGGPRRRRAADPGAVALADPAAAGVRARARLDGALAAGPGTAAAAT